MKDNQELQLTTLDNKIFEVENCTRLGAEPVC